MPKTDISIIFIFHALMDLKDFLPPEERQRRLRAAAKVIAAHPRNARVLIDLVCDVMRLSPDTMKSIIREIQPEKER